MPEKRCKSWDKYAASSELAPLTVKLVAFLSTNKTEREIVRSIEAQLRTLGAKSVEEIENASAGEIVYLNWKNRAIAVARLGTQSLKDGVNAIISHGDAPRIDIKERPLYEKDQLAFFDGHYYGGIKKYQWVNIPLALHGEVHNEKGHTTAIVVGEKSDEPQFTIPDLAIHVDSEMGKRTAKEAVEGENLDALVGSANSERNSEDNEHLNIESLKKLLNSQWGLEETSLAVAASWFAFMEADKSPKRTIVHMVMDKEEIGSDGVAGADGALFETFLLELLRLQNLPTDPLTLRRAIARTTAISADVTAGRNPLYEASYVRDQQPLCGNGVVIMKSSGSGGKYEASEARGEMMSAVIALLNTADVPWQVGSFGRIDKAGGGTLAKYIARLGADIIDIGPALLSMHSPLEIASKADFLALKECYRVFFNGMNSV